MSVSPGQLGSSQDQLGQKGMRQDDCQQEHGDVLVLLCARWVQGSLSMGILRGAILPRGQTPSQTAGSLAAQCILAEPQGIQLLGSLRWSGPTEPPSTRSSVESWEFSLPKKEIAPILSLAGAKDSDFFSFFFF